MRLCYMGHLQKAISSCILHLITGNENPAFTMPYKPYLVLYLTGRPYLRHNQPYCFYRVFMWYLVLFPSTGFDSQDSYSATPAHRRISHENTRHCSLPTSSDSLPSAASDTPPPYNSSVLPLPYGQV